MYELIKNVKLNANSQLIMIKYQKGVETQNDAVVRPSFYSCALQWMHANYKHSDLYYLFVTTKSKSEM